MVVMNAMHLFLTLGVGVFLVQGQAVYQQQSLQLHNHYRSLHHVEPLRINNTLYQMAMMCAQYYTSIGGIDHSCPHKRVPWGMWNTNAGENLWMGFSNSNSVSYSEDEIVLNTIDEWYKKEKVKHNFGNAFYQPSSGHFSQMVWKGTTEFGFAISASDSIAVAVALYYVPGNVDGDFLNNVFSETRN